MILPLAFALTIASQGEMQIAGASEEAVLTGPLDPSPLLSLADVAMLSPERERWAVATLESVGKERLLNQFDGEVSRVFDVDVRVLEGWNVPTGRLSAFVPQDPRRARRATLARMIGSRLLIRLAPTEDGHFLIVAGDDEKPAVSPWFTIGARSLLSLVIPTGAATLPKGTPKERRFYAL